VVIVIGGALTIGRVWPEFSPDVVLTISAALLSFLLLRIGNRATMSAVFIADISGLLEIIGRLGLLQRYDDLRKEATLPERLFFSSEEDYFTTFANNSGSIGFLRPQTAGEVTMLYVYLKAARDLQRRLKYWDSLKGERSPARNANIEKNINAKIEKDLKDIYDTMRQCAFHGLKALEYLGDDTANIKALKEQLGV
jgi:hypothetical protein